MRQLSRPSRRVPIHRHPAERRRVLPALLAGIGREGALEDWVQRRTLRISVLLAA